jgi:hypothetical protein
MLRFAIISETFYTTCYNLSIIPQGNRIQPGPYLSPNPNRPGAHPSADRVAINGGGCGVVRWRPSIRADADSPAKCHVIQSGLRSHHVGLFARPSGALRIVTVVAEPGGEARRPHRTPRATSAATLAGRAAAARSHRQSRWQPRHLARSGPRRRRARQKGWRGFGTSIKIALIIGKE